MTKQHISNEGTSPTLAFKRAGRPINNHTKSTNLSKPLGCSVVSCVEERLRNQLTAEANLCFPSLYNQAGTVEGSEERNIFAP